MIMSMTTTSTTNSKCNTRKQRLQILMLLINNALYYRYSICIRPEAGFCCVEYRICPDQALVGVAGNADIKAGWSFDVSRGLPAKADAGCG